MKDLWFRLSIALLAALTGVEPLTEVFIISYHQKKSVVFSDQIEG